MKLTDLGKGLNLDQPPWELAVGFWSAGQNVRFRTGRATRMGGIASALTPAIVPYFLMPHSSGATRYVMYAGLLKAYVHTGATETEITRATQPVAKTVSAATQAGTTVTITTSTVHGLATGDNVTTYNFKTGAGYFNKSNATITVTSTTVFTFVTTGSYTGSANTPLGSYTVNSSVNAVASNFTCGIDDKWSGGNFNGMVYVNNPVDGLFYWDQTVTGRLHSLADTTLGVQDAARHFKNWFFLLAPTTSGVKYRHRVQWSKQSDPGTVPTSFTASASNDAGLLDLVSEGECVDAKEYGDVFYVYKRDCRYSLRYVGGQFVFSEQIVSGNHKDDGLLAVNCIANTPKGQVFFTDGHDVRIHQGGESKSLVIGRVLDYIKSSIDTTNRKRSFLAVNPPFAEVWVCYPKSGSATCNEALVWNWEDDTWGIRTLTNVTAAGSGEYPTTIASDARLLVANSTPALGLVDSGYTDFGATITTSYERTGIVVGDAVYILLSSSWPYFQAATNFTASIFHGSAPTQNATPTYAAAVTYTHNTSDWCNASPDAGRFLAWKCTMTPNDTPSLVSIELDIQTQGAF